MVSNYKTLGNLAEKLALEYLEKQGLNLIIANFYSRFGEIDLIMRDNDCIVFIEVKWRTQGLSQALESISLAKQRRLIKTAQYFLLKLGKEVNCRFDALVIATNNQIEWLKNIITL